MTKIMQMSCLGLLMSAAMFAADAKKGAAVFDTNCSVCHKADSTETLMGPGLKGLYKKAALNNKKKPSDATVQEMIDQGGPGGMPAMGDSLTKTEKEDLLAYLKTL